MKEYQAYGTYIKKKEYQAYGNGLKLKTFFADFIVFVHPIFFAGSAKYK